MTAPTNELITGAENVLWDLSDLYAGIEDPLISRDLESAEKDAEAFAAQYRGKIASLSAAELAEAMAALAKIEERSDRVGSFAQLIWSTDVSNATYGALVQRSREAESRISQILLFFSLEWKAIPDETRVDLNDPRLALYHHALAKLLVYRPHTLSEPEEKILTEKAVTGRDAWVRFFGETVDPVEYNFEGQNVPQSVVLRGLYNPERAYRQRAADSVTAGLKTILRPVTYIMNTLLQEKSSTDRLRSFPTWISSRNLSNEAPDGAVEALISAVTSRYDIVARYYTLKKKLLGYDELFDYDRYAPLPGSGSTYTWEGARELILNAFGTFHPQMATIASEFFDHRWIHAPIKPGKRGGAYAAPTIASHHPYIFVNFAGMSRDVATLAHELGHGIHMYLSRPRGHFGAHTPLTTAEMASVFAEMVVFSDLLQRETDPRARLGMLAGKIEDSFATVFRQIAMNRFEDRIHTERRTKGELTTAQISAAWMDTQKAMFQGSVTLREDYSAWWAYVGHFIHTPGYVYAYAFGELLVLALFNKYKSEGSSFAPKYLEVLAAGGSDAPERILAKVGVDLNDPAFWAEGVKALDDLVSEAERLANA
ncbi:MAG TPA: M3 family oligoendopeptidase [Aggregatilineales bacterium]|nr:M3 family oligoendopeptidase [Anaerolineales bacterium]HRE47330.1 M3 family oligoendopeptidase [Aggregatilineales bacterium]